MLKTIIVDARAEIDRVLDSWGISNAQKLDTATRGRVGSRKMLKNLAGKVVHVAQVDLLVSLVDWTFAVDCGKRPIEDV